MNTNRNPENTNELGGIRAQIEREFTTLREEEPRVFQLALNEAEAIAMETGFPRLLFPVLATEKAEALARWHECQRAFRASEPSWAFAA